MSRRLAVVAAVAASIGAGLIHLALGPEHVEELGGLGWGFYLAAALQLGWAGVALVAVAGRRATALIGVAGRRAPAALARPRRLGAIAASGIAINVVILLAWAFARTFGLPAGEMPWVPEAIGPVDAICAALQLVVIAALLVRPSGARGPARMTAPRSAFTRALLAPALALVVIAAGTSVALSATGAHGADEAHPMAPATDVEIAGQPAGLPVHAH